MGITYKLYSDNCAPCHDLKTLKLPFFAIILIELFYNRKPDIYSVNNITTPILNS